MLSNNLEKNITFEQANLPLMKPFSKKTTKQVAVSVSDFNEVLEHALTHYGHLGKFYGIAAKEKMERDIKKMKATQE